MKSILLFLSALLYFQPAVLAQRLQLQGIINVWNTNSTIITLTDDFYYALAPGDEITITISGTANIAPYDEERKGGGFLGLFKKRYTVRIDNWLTADQVNLKVRVANQRTGSDYNDFLLSTDVATKTQTATFTIPFDDSKVRHELLETLKLKAWVNQYLSPLRAGKYDVLVAVNSTTRLDKLRQYFSDSTQDPQRLPILTFENDIKKFVENGKLIYRYPNETVKIIEETLINKPNSDGIKKDMYKYLLKFAPENTTVRAGLAEVYLKELNFSEAQLEAQQTIVQLSSKPEGSLTSKEQSDFGRAYEVIAGVNELKELGLQENAYSLGAVFYGQAAEWYRKAQSTEQYTNAIMKQVRCLQKVGDVIALKQAATILKEFDSEITR
jgi:hypothetical protein